GVHLDRVTEICGELLGEVDQRWPEAMQALKDKRCTVDELGEDLVVRDLISDLRARTSRGGEPTRVEHLAILDESEEGGAQSAGGQELICRLEVEQVVERRRQ